MQFQVSCYFASIVCVMCIQLYKYVTYKQLTIFLLFGYSTIPRMRHVDNKKAFYHLRDVYDRLNFAKGQKLHFVVRNIDL